MLQPCIILAPHDIIRAPSRVSIIMQIIEQAVGYKRGHLGYGVLMAMHEGLCRGRFCRVREEVQQLEITVVSIVETSLCMVGRGKRHCCA